MDGNDEERISDGSRYETEREPCDFFLGHRVDDQWYDFYIYGLMAATIFGKLFSHRPIVLGDALALSTLCELPFDRWGRHLGHLATAWGRKATLVATLPLMGVSTVLLRLVPTYDQIGVWGAVAITILRTLQGLGRAASGAGSRRRPDGAPTNRASQAAGPNLVRRLASWRRCSC